MRRSTQGFTLIELMIAVVIAGVLAAIAIPSYQYYVRKSRRADAHAALQTLQLAQERYRTNHTSYASDLASLPGGITLSADGHYQLSIDPGTASGSSYTVRATAVRGSSQAADEGCTQIWLAWADNAATYHPSIRCWNR